MTLKLVQGHLSTNHDLTGPSSIRSGQMHRCECFDPDNLTVSMKCTVNQKYTSFVALMRKWDQTVMSMDVDHHYQSKYGEYDTLMIEKMHSMNLFPKNFYSDYVAPDYTVTPI